MFDIEIGRDYIVRLKGNLDSPIGEELTNYYNLLEVDDGEPDIICEIGGFKKGEKQILGDPESHYAKIGDYFVIHNRNSEIAVHKSWDRILCSPTANRNPLTKIIEYKARQRLIQEGQIMIHASGIKYNGNTIIFPAWRHTGKTNTLISFLQKGANYLSDDRVWVTEDGTVQGYPLPVQMLPYNYRSFPDLSESSYKELARLKITGELSHIIKRKRSIFDEALYFFNRNYLGSESGEYRFLEEMIPQAEYTGKDDMDLVVFLQTTSSSEINISEIQKETALQSLYSTSFYEWNKDIYEYCHSFDHLFNKRSRVDQMEEFMQSEKEIFEKFVESKQLLQIQLPREEYWDKNNVTEQLLEKLELKIRDVSGKQ